MRLADFILRDMERILVQWEAFAAEMQPAAANMTPRALRNHAKQMLEAICKDLATAQSRVAQVEKSRGHAPRYAGAPETAAQTHALLRAKSGFGINQLAAEYRALRACVLRLWMDAGDPKESSLEDVIRFNEAIDQALAESVDFFSAEVDQARNLFFGMLGHDMRSPLQTIQMTAHYLSALNAGTTVSDAAARLINSGTRMKELLDDLLDFNRTKFGFGINIAPTDIDAALLVAEELNLVRGAHPGRAIELEVVGDVRGYWDGPRLRRLLGNLLLNAIKYGAADSPIRVSVEDQGADVRLTVRNGGSAIDPAILDDIFEPLKGGIDYENASDADSSLGLGLYIAREIAKAHGGEINVRSDANETMFSVRLPRRKSS
jgi:signal transduction histidine kinase